MDSNLATVSFLEKLLAKFKPPSSDEGLPEKEKPEQLLEEVTFEGVGKYIKEGHCEYTCKLYNFIYFFFLVHIVKRFRIF